MRYVIPLLLLALSVVVAHADVPPPRGYKRVSYSIELKNQREFKDYVFFVYPWSDSNGVPMAELGEFSGDRLSFGRRILDTPRLYAIKRDQYQAYVRAQEQVESRDPVKGFPYIDCGVEINTRHTVSDDHSGGIVDVYVIKSVSGSKCVVEKQKTK